MARGTMHAPKPEDQRRRRNKPAADETALVRDGELRGPELPQDEPWLPQTREWHETWRRAPQAQVMETTDWMRLRMLAKVVNEYFLTGDAKLLAEIRMNEERLGATYTDRQRARMRIVDPALAEGQQPGFAGNVTDARDRFARGG
jgi:hypothetical protein